MNYPSRYFQFLDQSISNECSKETNQVSVKLRFSHTGKVEEFKFLSKSSISAINEEAKKNILAASPYSEFEDITEKEKYEYREAIMHYKIPCKSHNQKMLSMSDGKD